jgi:hypothetical protein
VKKLKLNVGILDNHINNVLTCDYCGHVGDDVKYTIDPFQDVIYGDKTKHNLCIECWNEQNINI